MTMIHKPLMSIFWAGGGSGSPARHGALLEGGCWQDRQVFFFPVTKPASLLFHSNYLPQMPKNTMPWDLENFYFLKQSQCFELFCRAASQHLGGFCHSSIPQPTQNPASASAGDCFRQSHHSGGVKSGFLLTLALLPAHPRHVWGGKGRQSGAPTLMGHQSLLVTQNIPVAAAADLQI